MSKTYIKTTSNAGHTYTGPFSSEQAARQYWMDHQIHNIESRFVPESEMPQLFGRESIGTLGGSGWSANAMNLLIEV